MNVTLTHTVDELNYILNALAQRPYGEVKELIEKIKTAAETEIAKASPVATSENAEHTVQ